MPPWIERLWYGRSTLFPLFLPFSLLFTVVVLFKRWWWLKKGPAITSPVPVWVVGNLSVGGTGKTPLVLALLEIARQRGIRAGVVSRGYGGKAESYPLSVEDDPRAAIVGDEPLLIWQRSHCPVVVGPYRATALAELIRRYQPDWVISDDGLQHYALPRDRELVVVDAKRGLGNGWCLPAGPLREPPGRLTSVDWVIGNGGPVAGGHSFYRLQPGDIVSLDGTQRLPASEWKRPVHAVAGIGNPKRFFATLDELGIDYKGQSFPDHHQYQLPDFSDRETAPLLMTEKDAVKCRELGLEDAWYLEVRAELEPQLELAIIAAIERRRSHDG